MASVSRKLSNDWAKPMSLICEGGTPVQAVAILYQDPDGEIQRLQEQMDMTDAQAQVLMSDVGTETFHMELVHVDDSEYLVTTVCPLAIHARCTDISQQKGLVIVATSTALVVGTYGTESGPATDAVHALCQLSGDLANAGF
eukprot:TRINITY_DN60941_c0_g1_i4.p1 TRINITY_DN60941_c0_g1~~TRINITY_DN60941_c0_g1_i4.p1  ORF type:complete len:142 (-),score=25.59 TRINITY_DN60941_c0_g1_i4:391-816(-)